jgi:hypothetical protein
MKLKMLTLAGSKQSETTITPFPLEGHRKPSRNREKQTMMNYLFLKTALSCVR